MSAVEEAVWRELNKRRWFAKHVEDEEIEALERDLSTAIADALDAPAIEYRAVDDWVALYKDGKKVAEGHSIPTTRALAALGIEFTNKYWDHDEMDEVLGVLKDGTDPFPETI